MPNPSPKNSRPKQLKGVKLENSGRGKGDQCDDEVADDEMIDHSSRTPPSEREQSHPKKFLKQFLQQWKIITFDRRLEILILGLGVVIATAVLGLNAVQLKQMRETMELDQRPWVGIDKIQILSPPTEGQSFKVRGTILNGGKSPALYVMQYSAFKPWIKPDDDLSIPLTNDPAISHCFQTNPEWNPGLTGAMILPGASSVHLSPESPILDKEKFNVIMKIAPTDTNSPSMRSIPRSPASEKAERLTVGLFLVGCIDYFDQFRNPHRTGICYLYDSSGGGRYGDFTNCANGNSAD